MGTYLSCPAYARRAAYNETITARSAGPATVSRLDREVVAILTAAGWHLVSVDMAKMRLPLGSPPHPLYRISSHGMRGAANILRYAHVRAVALIFMHSPCFDASPIYTSLIPSIHPH